MTADPDPAHYASEYHRLKSIEAEYKITIQVVAVLAQALLKTAGRKIVSAEIRLDDDTLLNAPELRAWRDDERRQTVITIKE